MSFSMQPDPSTAPQRNILAGLQVGCKGMIKDSEDYSNFRSTCRGQK